MTDSMERDQFAEPSKKMVLYCGEYTVFNASNAGFTASLSKSRAHLALSLTENVMILT